MEGSVADLRQLPRSATDPSIIPLSEEGVTHRNVGDYYCHLSRHPFVSQIKYIVVVFVVVVVFAVVVVFVVVVVFIGKSNRPITVQFRNQYFINCCLREEKKWGSERWGNRREFQRREVVNNGEILRERRVTWGMHRCYSLGASSSLGAVFRGSKSVLITK